MVYDKNNDRGYPVLNEEVQAAVEQHKLYVAKLPNIGPAEKAQRFADNLPVDLDDTIDDILQMQNASLLIGLM